ncbi:hypothetical protein GCM10010329_03730 [Streptomyces spiroverticillatus]|uniref:Uncharacterized protein n=1 Tax=Streptomyces finlayi TaxID=67296 RepID=A0A918WSK2_9ACTN|nr:hypothetical protein [Streptomyces finlayi]GGZ87067.1 hypothetical protein GCM10010329_03730 [Streptomyces spiroverticillatus]GHC78442.1 hypothetical protein GCM10010334_03710 [Streptomyces finlayi]
MSLQRHKNDEVRLVLEQAARPVVPSDLLVRATERGARQMRRRRALRRVWWVIGTLVVIAFLVWASIVHPWQAPPADFTPPVEGF